ncbi:hypothetical protein [Streptomyces sp. NPDC006552]|uniref:hypothetical protein n=1 Tax=Streptomyces sp. NPDC006552 TaxID=3157179 RepID=UPI0033BE4839
MSKLCAHRRPDHHVDGETCRYASELKPGDQINVLNGVLVRVLQADPIEDAEDWIAVLLDGSVDGPTPLARDSILPVRPADGLRPDEMPAPDRDVEVRATVEVTEEVVYEATLTLTVPASVTVDDAALLAHLDAHWSDYNDVIEGGAGTVTDQNLSDARIVQRKDATS